MNKNIHLEKNWFAILFITAFVALSGCEEFASDESFYKVTIPTERFRQIETLELESISIDANEPAEVNEPTQEHIELTLPQCRALALENNLDLKVQLIEPAIASERISEEEAHFEAAFFSNLSYSKTDTPTSTQLTGSQVDSSNVNLGVEVPSRTGGTVTFNMTDRRAKQNAEYAYSTFNPSYSSDLSVSISQPLLKNAGKRTNTHAIRIARYDQQITDARTKLETITVIADVDRFYWRLYAARRELVVRKQEYELAQAQLQRAQRFVDAGERPLIEVIRAEAGLAQRLEAIIVAENNVRDRQRELKQIINKSSLPITAATVIVPATEPDPVNYKLDSEKLVANAIDNRMEMLELELQIAKDASTIDYLGNQALPALTLGYTYNINGLGATRDDSFEMLFDKDFEDHQLGLQLLVPLGNQAAASRLRQAFYLRRQHLATKENRRLLIQLETLNALDQLQANWQRILASRQRTILDGRLYKAEQRQFELGLGTSTDVLEAQTIFADAQSAEIRALTEYQIAMVDLAYATGTLLGAAKVQWQPLVPPGAPK